MIVLERIARGGGATNWYVIRDAKQVRAVAARLRPGSSVSFYFDGRLAHRPHDQHLIQEVVAIAKQDSSAVVGTLASDGMTLDVDFVSSEAELEEFVGELAAGTEIYFGRFPERNSDGVRAVTMYLPDSDGITRLHPH